MLERKKKSWCKLSQPNGPRGSKLAQQYHILYAWNITIPRALLVASYFLDKQTSTGNTFHIADVALPLSRITLLLLAVSCFKKYCLSITRYFSCKQDQDAEDDKTFASHCLGSFNTLQEPIQYLGHGSFKLYNFIQTNTFRMCLSSAHKSNNSTYQKQINNFQNKLTIAARAFLLEFSRHYYNNSNT